MINRVPGLLMTATLFLLCACGSVKKLSSPETSASRLLPPLPPSTINIPVHICLHPLLTRMDSTTAKEFTSDKWPGYTQTSCDFRYKYRFIRSPFYFYCDNNRVGISFRGYYQIAGSRSICAFDRQVSPWVSGSCGFGGETLRRVDLHISSQLQLMPNHQIRTTTHLDQMTPLDKCEVTVMQNDMTKLVMDSIRASVESYCSSFDGFIQALNNNPFLQQWRASGSRVMPVSKYGFLNINPTQLRISPFNYNRDTLYFSMGLDGEPAFSSDSSRLVTHAPLPPVTLTGNTGGISTWLDAVYDYSFFNKLLNDSLGNKPFEVDGRTFVIKDVHISGTNEGKIRVDVSFTGNKKGVLHLSGTPVLDTARQVLSMPDIEVAVDSRDMLVKIARGLIRKKIMKQLANESVLDIAALVQKNKEVIGKRLNQPVTDWMSTAGTLRDLKLVGLLPQKDYIEVQVYISADLCLIGHPPSNLLEIK